MLSPDSFEASFRLERAIANCSVGVFFVMKSALKSISFNSSSVRPKATEIQRHNRRPITAGKPWESGGGDTDDTDRLTL